MRANGSGECSPDDRLREAIQSHERRLDCFVAEFIIGPAEGGTRWLLAMTNHSHGCASAPINPISGIRGPSGMYS